MEPSSDRAKTLPTSQLLIITVTVERDETGARGVQPVLCQSNKRRKLLSPSSVPPLGNNLPAVNYEMIAHSKSKRVQGDTAGFVSDWQVGRSLSVDKTANDSTKNFCWIKAVCNLWKTTARISRCNFRGACSIDNIWESRKRGKILTALCRLALAKN